MREILILFYFQSELFIMILLFICLFCFCDSRDVFETRPRIINNPRIKRNANPVLQVKIKTNNNNLCKQLLSKFMFFC